MIKVSTLLYSADNSGAIKLMCLNIPKLNKTKGATVGCVITVTVKENIFKKAIKKKSRIINKSQIVKAAIITTVRAVKRWGNFFLTNQYNNAVLLNQYELPYGTRLFGPVFRELRQRLKFKKIVSLATVII